MTRPEPPDALPPEQQSALFEAAAKEFAARGFDGASLDRILGQSGIGTTAFADHFADKAGLFTRLIERSLSVLFGQIGPFDPDQLTAETYWSEIAAYYHRAITLVDHNDWMVRFGRLFYQLRDTPALGSATNPLFDITRDWVRKLIARGQALGSLRADLPPDLMTDIAMGILEPLDRWSAAHWPELSEAERQALPDQHIDLFRRAFTAASPRA
ncbi:TetR/AcrR family transcriptional regulator [Pseudodonghicola xiamenensis]|uniref:HTH tetR-type domain-containing protein n=1 Tax=Pseudodonghicola xiamenensis TaxID=337702 RepID=A0A8J3HB83_9RHOB|nr:TetR/AcrR family transcriptional regulator [Pseudodonghicola xiamenensis]GHH03324.1 hypothetical protein GCM10010961_41370 [Pseudodonghicola xiamenensis]